MKNYVIYQIQIYRKLNNQLSYVIMIGRMDAKESRILMRQSFLFNRITYIRLKVNSIKLRKKLINWLYTTKIRQSHFYAFIIEIRSYRKLSSHWSNSNKITYHKSNNTVVNPRIKVVINAPQCVITGACSKTSISKAVKFPQ